MVHRTKPGTIARTNNSCDTGCMDVVYVDEVLFQSFSPLILIMTIHVGMTLVFWATTRLALPHLYG